MDIDWIVAIVVFLVFVGWAFSYYFTLFPENRDALKPVVEIDRDKIMDFLQTDVYTLPVKLNSSTVDNAVLKASGFWYHGTKNSTKVFQGSVSLPCMIIGDDLYWVANLSSGWNYFGIEFSGVETNLNCNSTFSLVNVTQTVPWTIERKEMISLSKINNMTNTSYEKFKKNLGIEEDFSLSLKWDGSEVNYGRKIPEVRNVYAKKYESLMWENSKPINISMRVW